MGTWGPGNFEDDGALDYLDELTDGWMAQLTATIEGCFADEDRSALDEEGEAVIVPTVAVMSILCEQCHAQPPRPDVVTGWKREYLAIYDEQIDEREPAPDYKVERRRTIEQTFDKLEAQASEYWERMGAAKQAMEERPSE